MHKQFYNHKTVKAVECMLSDIIKAIDPIFNINESISDMDKFIQLTDTSIIHYLNLVMFPSPIVTIKLSKKQQINMDRAVKLWGKIQRRKLYKYVGHLINRPDVTVESFIKMNNGVTLDNLILCRYKIGYIGGNKQNPVDNIYFYDKKESHTSFKLKPEDISTLLPNEYQEHYTVIFSRTSSGVESLRSLFDKIKSCKPESMSSICDSSHGELDSRSDSHHDSKNDYETLTENLEEDPTLSDTIDDKTGLSTTPIIDEKDQTPPKRKSSKENLFN
jgi:hypothetical protein